jgi:bifunctional aspartokinase / homoserine dehydrogenase 1
MRVLKFGGSTLRQPTDCTLVADVVRKARRQGEVIVVVSALYGVTDRLAAVLAHAEAGAAAQCRRACDVLREEHQIFAQEILSPRELSAFFAVVEARVIELAQLCEGILQLDECSARTRDRCMGYGELLSSALIAGVLRDARVKAAAIDARTLLVTDAAFGNAKVEITPTRQRLREARKGWQGSVPVITGFIGATAEGVPTTVGRNGSDFTAALIGAFLKAKEVEIWTDVDGILSADPTQVTEAFPLEHLTYPEAMEMAYFGAKVLHPRAVLPAILAKVPLRIRNLFHLDFVGTVISARASRTDQPVKGITAIPDMALVSLEGAGMIGVNGVAGRMFAALSEAGINVTLISQGSSEQSICCAVQRSDGVAATQILETAFAIEISRGEIRSVTCDDTIAVIAIVGTAMRGTPGISARLFGALGKNHINVIAIAQGSCEQNISLVIEKRDVTKALNVIHGAFHLAARHAYIVVIGKGRIGETLLKQIAAGQARLEHDLDLRLRVVGIADSRRLLFDAAGLSMRGWRQRLARKKPSKPLEQVGALLCESHLENIICVDATASDSVAKKYPEWLGAGLSVVTPNKKANTLDQKYYDELQEIVRRRNSYYLYETCVGAGLPVVSTLQDLIDSGDEILHIEAALSGTLGYLFSEIERGVPFSQVVIAALKLGYTEPDPREDLSGMDVARKLLILARKTGARLSLSQVKVEPLLPAALRKGGSVPAFLKKLQQVDAAYAHKVAAAEKKGRVLRYIGSIKGARCQVQLKAVPKDSPFGSLVGGDNLVVFTTKRYHDNPLIVRGPGAGPDVTAGGVFADILKVAHLLTS